MNKICLNQLYKYINTFRRLHKNAKKYFTQFYLALFKQISHWKAKIPALKAKMVNLGGENAFRKLVNRLGGQLREVVNVQKLHIVITKRTEIQDCRKRST